MTHAMAHSSLTRSRVRVRGLVQGVGYRPFIHNLAGSFGLTGWVLNDSDGVLMEVQGGDCSGFLQSLNQQAPPLARIEGIEVRPVSPEPAEAGFEIRASVLGGGASTAIGPDTGVCEACLAELFDPENRRWRYPFLNCTHCGPRHTITRALPYPLKELTRSRKFQQPALANLWKSIGKSYLRKRMAGHMALMPRAVTR